MAKLPASRSASYIARPDPAHVGLLLYGPDPTLVAARRREVVKTLLGADDDPFALATLSGDQIRKDPALLVDEASAISFMGGERVVVCPDAADGHVKAFAAALDTVKGARLVACAGQLPTSSKLRKLFEGATNAMALPFYPPEGTGIVDAVAATLSRMGGPRLSDGARREIGTAMAGAQFGEAERFAEVLALYANRESIEAEDVLAIAPPSAETDYDAAIQAVMSGALGAIPPLLDRLSAQGLSLPGLLRILALYMQRLHRIQAGMASGATPEAAIGAMRPPVFFKLRDVLARQARGWSRPAVEGACLALNDLEAELRSGAPLPERALIERTLMRIARTAPRR